MLRARRGWHADYRGGWCSGIHGRWWKRAGGEGWLRVLSMVPAGMGNRRGAGLARVVAVGASLGAGATCDSRLLNAVTRRIFDMASAVLLNDWLSTRLAQRCRTLPDRLGLTFLGCFGIGADLSLLLCGCFLLLPLLATSFLVAVFAVLVSVLAFLSARVIIRVG